MSTKTEDIQFYEWLFGRRDTPYIKDDKILVPFPINYTPIDVDYVDTEHEIAVVVK
jgi:hypothetical protein